MKKKTILLYNTEAELKWANGKAHDRILHVNEIGGLPPMLNTGDKVIVYDIYTDFLTLNFMLTFFEFARKKGITFESVCQNYLCFSASRPLPYKITNYLLEMQTFRNQLWNMRRYYGISDDNTPQAREYLLQCDQITKRAISIALATDGLLRR